VIGVVVREAAESSRAQPVMSAVTIIMVTGMIVVGMLTTGRTVGSEQQILASIDSAGTRTIVVRAEPEAGLTSDVLERMGAIEGIEWAGGFSNAVDGINSLVPDGKRTPTRFIYGTHLERLGIPSASPDPGGLAWASQQALDTLGMPDANGGVTLTTGASYGVVGELDVPDFLNSFEPLVLVPQPDATGLEPIGILLVIVETPELVATISDAVMSVTATENPTKITLQTSEALTTLRALVEGQLGSFSRSLVLTLLGLTGGLLAVLLFSLVMMRRKDFGRRRALGASRGFIIGLILTQTGLLAGTGILIGLTISSGLLIVSDDPLPGMSFATALSVLALGTALIAATMPAIAASRREPIRELRVP
jgi:putative ABC transport system permease protein